MGRSSSFSRQRAACLATLFWGGNTTKSWISAGFAPPLPLRALPLSRPGLQPRSLPAAGHGGSRPLPALGACPAAAAGAPGAGALVAGGGSARPPRGVLPRPGPGPGGGAVAAGLRRAGTRE